MVDKIAPERIWAYTGSVMNGVAIWEWGLAYRTSDMEDDDWPDPVEYVRADVVEALRTDLARAVGALEKCEKIQTRVQQDTYWRSPDNTLWPDLCDTTNSTRAIITSFKGDA